MAILSFNGRVNIGINQTLEKFPKAKFLVAVGYNSSEEAVNNPKDFDLLQLKFWKDEYSHLETSSKGYAEFNEPEIKEDVWLECRIMDFSEIQMDLPEAWELKEAAGYNLPCVSVTLRHILNPNHKNPYFIFGQENHLFVAVDTVTKEVKIIK